jgi:hypothetical protein
VARQLERWKDDFETIMSEVWRTGDGGGGYPRLVVAGRCLEFSAKFKKKKNKIKS